MAASAKVMHVTDIETSHSARNFIQARSGIHPLMPDKRKSRRPVSTGDRKSRFIYESDKEKKKNKNVIYLGGGNGTKPASQELPKATQNFSFSGWLMLPKELEWNEVAVPPVAPVPLDLLPWTHIV